MSIYYFIKHKRYHYIRDRKVTACKGSKADETSAAAEEIPSSENTSTASEHSNPGISDFPEITQKSIPPELSSQESIPLELNSPELMPPGLIPPEMEADQKASPDHKDPEKTDILKELPLNPVQKSNDRKYRHIHTKIHTGLKKLNSLSRLRPIFDPKVYKNQARKLHTIHKQSGHL